MGHGPSDCCTAHGSWAFYSVVQHCITHGSWEVVTMYGPWVMGKKSLKGLTSNHGFGGKVCVLFSDSADHLS